MATITPQSVVATGTTPTYGAVSASDQFASDPGGLIYHVKNGGGSPDTVTVADGGTTGAGNTGQSSTVSVPAGAERVIYVNPQLVNASTGFITVTHSFITSVTAALYRGV
jgi:hypothetical protein